MMETSVLITSLPALSRQERGYAYFFSVTLW
jgi:hypothetical protein